MLTSSSFIFVTTIIVYLVSLIACAAGTGS